MTFADQLTSQRKRAGYTRSALAKELGVSLNQVAKWEGGESEPSLTILRQLHSIYEISMDELILNETTSQSVSPSRWLTRFDKDFKKK
ncbi:helix-turn-helix domain-containing protein [Pediococcus parvulus]|uniref:helix-turn-helix domain-containing protein n=1 Tax=Pediococcus parvulus TaxID=54062 RepID=UPI0021A2C8D1|nr:helix-turn-helix transcriptional regulator [Pediococcus parvulus]MCT3034512.1 XRE family transcriptional regulator [Pediococcus parvulus]